MFIDTIMTLQGFLHNGLGLPAAGSFLLAAQLVIYSPLFVMLALAGHWRRKDMRALRNRLQGGR